MDESGISKGKVIAVAGVIALVAGAIWYFVGPKAAEATDEVVMPIESGLRGIDEARAVRDAVNLRTGTTSSVDLDAVRRLGNPR